MLSLAAAFLLPALSTLTYAGLVMTPQYDSTFSFVVHQQQQPSLHSASLASVLGGGSPMLAMREDPQVVVKYIRSHQILTDIGDKIDLRKIYAGSDIDWFSRMDADASREQRLRYWRSMVSPSFDLASGIVTVNVRAFSSADAQRVAAAVLGGSEALVNRMSEQARSSILIYAGKAVAGDRADLSGIEQKMAAYRNAHAVVFPQLTATTNSSVQGHLLSKLTEATATMKSLESQGQRASSPQIQILRARIAAIQAELDKINGSMAADQGDATLASVIAGYDALQTRKELTLKLYTADLESLQAARQRADQQQIYLEDFVTPNLPQKSTYPKPWRWALAAGVVGFVVWSIGSLVFAAVVDLFE